MGTATQTDMPPRTTRLYLAPEWLADPDEAMRRTLFAAGIEYAEAPTGCSERFAANGVTLKPLQAPHAARPYFAGVVVCHEPYWASEPPDGMHWVERRLLAVRQEEPDPHTGYHDYIEIADVRRTYADAVASRAYSRAKYASEDVVAMSAEEREERFRETKIAAVNRDIINRLAPAAIPLAVAGAALANAVQDANESAIAEHSEVIRDALKKCGTAHTTERIPVDVSSPVPRHVTDPNLSPEEHAMIHRLVLHVRNSRSGRFEGSEEQLRELVEASGEQNIGKIVSAAQVVLGSRAVQICRSAALRR